MKSSNQWEELQKLEKILLKDHIRLTRQELRVLYETMTGKGNAKISQMMHVYLEPIN